MNLAKVTTKGQITIPVEIRRKLKVRNGDKLLFLEENGKIYIMNSSVAAFRTAQNELDGVAEALGLTDEEDVSVMLSELRKEKANENRG